MLEHVLWYVKGGAAVTDDIPRYGAPQAHCSIRRVKQLGCVIGRASNSDRSGNWSLRSSTITCHGNHSHNFSRRCLASSGRRRISAPTYPPRCGLVTARINYRFIRGGPVVGGTDLIFLSPADFTPGTSGLFCTRLGRIIDRDSRPVVCRLTLRLRRGVASFHCGSGNCSRRP